MSNIELYRNFLRYFFRIKLKYKLQLDIKLSTLSQNNMFQSELRFIHTVLFCLLGIGDWRLSKFNFSLPFTKVEIPHPNFFFLKLKRI